jgi:hypothetical protein
VIGGAAKVVQRGGLEREVRLPDNIAAIKVLHFLVELESTALEQYHVESRIV